MIAGQRRAQSTEVLTVDYKDVLDQAVLNERRRILHNLRTRIGNLATSQPSARGRSWDTEPRKAADFKADVLKEITYEENAD